MATYSQLLTVTGSPFTTTVQAPGFVPTWAAVLNLSSGTVYMQYGQAVIQNAEAPQWPTGTYFAVNMAQTGAPTATLTVFVSGAVAGQQIQVTLSSSELSGNPGNVGPVVVSKTETLYDSNGNPLLDGSTAPPNLYGAAIVKPSGSDDTALVQSALNAGGEIWLPYGTYQIGGALTIPDGVYVHMASDATLIIGSTVTVGSPNSAATNMRCQLRCQPSSTFQSVLFAVYNLQSCEFSVELSAAATYNDMVRIHSTNGVGATDSTYRIRSNQKVCYNGIVLQNGDGTVKSIAGDFINGNIFERCDIAASNVPLTLYPTGTPSGSVSGTIERNYFLRCDWNSYAVAAVKSASAGNASYNHFVNCTFESDSGGAPLDVDLTTNAINGGQTFDHIATRSYATQKLNAADMWLWGENDTRNYGGNTTTYASFSGRTAGTVYWSAPTQDQGYKKVAVYLSGYENNTGTADTVTFPLAFALAPDLRNPSSVPGVTVSTTALTIDPNNATTYSAWLFVEGF